MLHANHTLSINFGMRIDGQQRSIFYRAVETGQTDVWLFRKLAFAGVASEPL